MFVYEFYRLVDFLVAVVILSIIMVGLAFFLAPASSYRDKMSPYECGFHPFEDARKEFNVHFYLVALLFVAFDLEILVLIPWVLALSHVSVLAYWSVVVFLVLLTVGFIYEWKSGSLDW